MDNQKNPFVGVKSRQVYDSDKQGWEKGRTKTRLNLAPENIEKLTALLTELKGSHVSLDIINGKKDGLSYDSTFIVVQEQKNAKGTAQGTFVPKDQTTSPVNGVKGPVA